MSTAHDFGGHKTLLIIMDGWGLNKDYEGNAITRAKTPNYDKLWQDYPTATLEASGEAVGLPEGQMGTSEVNHFTIGAGKIVFQDLVRINHAIDDGSFGQNGALIETLDHVKNKQSTLHLMGLLSDGGVHSHLNHFTALIKAAKAAGVKEVCVHAFTDGRDTGPQSSLGYIQALEAEMAKIGVGEIVSLIGRYYAMDRDHNWDRTNLAYHLLTERDGEKFSSATKAAQASHQAGVTDEFIKPSVIDSKLGDRAIISAGDGLIFVNFRNDRPRQLTETFLKHDLDNLCFTTMTRYNPFFNTRVMFEPQDIELCLGQVISEAKLKQVRITETEKFAHMTYFLNCKHEEPFEGEDRVMFDSYSDIPTHDHRPEMRVHDISKELIGQLERGDHQVIFTNLCNPDMVGHTGNIPAAIAACEAVDGALGEIIPVALANNYTVLLTADHGNADEMLDEETGEVITSHSLNPVPFILISEHFSELKRRSGLLIDIAPTILSLLDLPKPQGMAGESFI